MEHTGCFRVDFTEKRGGVKYGILHLGYRYPDEMA